MVLLPGDGIGPEVVREAAKVLRATAPAVELAEQPIGAAAMERTGSPLPEPTLTACLAAEAVLMGAVGVRSAVRHL